MDLNANDLVDEIERNSDEGQPLTLYWLALSGDRDQLAAAISASGRATAIVPWVWRSTGFDEPNAVANDIRKLLALAREDVLSVADAARTAGRVAVVVLARRELGIAVSSSPLLLPAWFPLDGGLTVTVRLRDLSWSIHVPISHAVSRVGDMQGLLYDLDGVLLDRIRSRARHDPTRVRGLLDKIGLPGDLSSILGSLGKTRARTLNPSSFRPSARGGTVVGTLWGHVNSTSPDRLARSAKAMSQTLAKGEVADGQTSSIVGVLNRPTNVIDDPSVVWFFSLLLSVRTACQFVTAAAHADEYPRYPTALLRSMSFDIRRFLNDACTRLGEPGQ